MLFFLLLKLYTKIIQMENTTTHHSCPWCNNKDVKNKWNINSFNLIECPKCDVIYVKEILTPSELASYYNQSPDVVYEDDNVEFIKYYYRKLKNIIEKEYSQKGKILDIGSSGGWFLDEMEGWDRHGIEIAEKDALKSQQRYGNQIFIGSLEDYPIKKDYFDVIALQDVFDHLPMPKDALKKCWEMLKPGGMIIIKVHDMDCLYAKITGRNFYALIPPYHLFYYNRRNLGVFLQENGFSNTYYKHIGHILKFETIFWRLSHSGKKMFWYKIFKIFNNTKIGQIAIPKNLNDIVTYFGKKKVD